MFSVSLSETAFQCFRCGAKGNQLDLWAAVYEMNIYDAARDLAEKFGVDAHR